MPFRGDDAFRGCKLAHTQKMRCITLPDEKARGNFLFRFNRNRLHAAGYFPPTLSSLTRYRKGDCMSSISSGVSRYIHAACAAFALFSSTSVYAQTEHLARDPFAVVPFYDPQRLQEIAALDDQSFVSQLFAPSGNVTLIEQLFPSENAVFPVSHGFAGVQNACLRTRMALACRLYVDDLIDINQRNAPQGGAYTNPFEPRW